MNIHDAKKMVTNGTPVHRKAWILPFARLITGTASKKSLSRVCHSSSEANPAVPEANAGEEAVLVAITDDEAERAESPIWVPLQTDVEADDYQPWVRPEVDQVVEVMSLVTAAQVASQTEGGNDAA